MRQICQPDHLGARHHVQGNGLVRHGLFRQAQTTERRVVQTHPHQFDTRKGRDGIDTGFHTGPCGSIRDTGLRRKHRKCLSFDRQRVYFKRIVQLELIEKD